MASTVSQVYQGCYMALRMGMQGISYLFPQPQTPITTMHSAEARAGRLLGVWLLPAMLACTAGTERAINLCGRPCLCRAVYL